MQYEYGCTGQATKPSSHNASYKGAIKRRYAGAHSARSASTMHRAGNKEDGAIEAVILSNMLNVLGTLLDTFPYLVIHPQPRTGHQGAACRYSIR